jgi:hypothetical protein
MYSLHIYIYIYIYIHVFMYICLHIYVNICMCIYAHFFKGMKGDKDGNIMPFLIGQGIQEGLTSMRPHQHIYAPYDR